jgi:uncharacterized protein (DUF433 family)
MDDRIECRPDIMLGKPVVAGTRITVELILESLAAGESIAELIEQYPVTREDVLAALAYAARSLHSEFVFSSRRPD